jgi:hypothetical protein
VFEDYDFEFIEAKAKGAKGRRFVIKALRLGFTDGGKANYEIHTGNGTLL